MAFPTIQTGDTQSGSQTSNSTSWTGTYPTNLANGDLILMFLAADGSGVITSPMTNWGVAVATQGNVALSLAAKRSDGTESGTFTIPLTANEQGTWVCYRITGDSGIAVVTGFTNFDTNGWTPGPVVSSVKSTGTDAAPNPANLSIGSAEDRLWLAICAVDTSRAISSGPAGMSLIYSTASGGASGASLGVAQLNQNASSYDPATFAISTSDDWIATTLLVYPASVSAPGPVWLPPQRRASDRFLIRR